MAESVQYVDHLIAMLITLIAGLVIHLFIIGVNVSDWWRGRSVTPVDHIVTFLGISRLCSQCTNTVYFICLASFLSDLFSSVIIDTVLIFFNCINIWLTSLLSIVLCLKISNLHTRLFLYLRRMILHRTGCLVVALVIVSAFNSIFTFLPALTKITSGATYNTTMDDLVNDSFYITSLYTFLGTFLPVLFCCVSSVLLYFSLYHHTTRMKMSSNLSINLETYYSVMRFISFTFIYNTVYFIVHFICAFYLYFYYVDLLWLYIVLEFLPVLHSSYLIYSTAKLRNQMSKVLQNVMDCVFQRKNTETRENIEIVAQDLK